MASGPPVAAMRERSRSRCTCRPAVLATAPSRRRLMRRRSGRSHSFPASAARAVRDRHRTTSSWRARSVDEPPLRAQHPAGSVRRSSGQHHADTRPDQHRVLLVRAVRYLERHHAKCRGAARAGPVAGGPRVRTRELRDDGRWHCVLRRQVPLPFLASIHGDSPRRRGRQRRHGAGIRTGCHCCGHHPRSCRRRFSSRRSPTIPLRPPQRQPPQPKCCARGSESACISAPRARRCPASGGTSAASPMPHTRRECLASTVAFISSMPSRTVGNKAKALAVRSQSDCRACDQDSALPMRAGATRVRGPRDRPCATAAGTGWSATACASSSCRRRALEHDPPALAAAFGAQVDDPVGVADDVQVVLDDDHRVAAVDQPVR